MPSLTLTHGGALSNLPMFVALDANLFAAHGLTVSAPPLDGFGATAMRLRDGSADFGTGGFTQALACHDAADPLVIVAGSGMRGMALVGAHGVAMADLAGQIVGSFPDDPMDLLLRDLLERHGLSNVTVQSMGSLKEAAAALADGSVRAITTVEPWIGRLREAGATILSDGTDVWGPDYPDTTLVTRRSFLEARPDAIVAAIRAMHDAEGRIRDDPPEALALVAHRFPGFALRELLKGLEGQPPRVDIRGLEHTILGRWPAQCRLQGRAPSPPPADLIDLRCLAEAIDIPSPPSTSARKTHVH